MVNFIKEACEEANCDTSLKNLVAMLREACTILFAKAKAKLLNTNQRPDANDSYVSAQHLRKALEYSRKGYEHLEDLFACTALASFHLALIPWRLAGPTDHPRACQAAKGGRRGRLLESGDQHLPALAGQGKCSSAIPFPFAQPVAVADAHGRRG